MITKLAEVERGCDVMGFFDTKYGGLDSTSTPRDSDLMKQVPRASALTQIVT